MPRYRKTKLTTSSAASCPSNADTSDSNTAVAASSLQDDPKSNKNCVESNEYADKLCDMMRDLQESLVISVQARKRYHNTFISIGKLKYGMQSGEFQESSSGNNQSLPVLKSKLKSEIEKATKEVESEEQLLLGTLSKIAAIKTFRMGKLLTQVDGKTEKRAIERQVLLDVLQQHADSLPWWVGTPGEKAPFLCGAIPEGEHYIADFKEKVVALLPDTDGASGDQEEKWILAEVTSFNQRSNKYNIRDIDAPPSGPSVTSYHTLAKDKIIPLPKWRVLVQENTENCELPIFEKGTLVLALYPQTTCFYMALVEQTPSEGNQDYCVVFADPEYPSGYTPSHCVPQAYVLRYDRKK